MLLSLQVRSSKLKKLFCLKFLTKPLLDLAIFYFFKTINQIEVNPSRN